jgi:hypothetical protein
MPFNWHQFLTTACSAVLLCLSEVSASLRISEFMASNDGALTDEDGDSSDWIEIENTGINATSAGGWFLTDSPENLNHWQFPPVEIPAGGYLVVFASGKDRATAGSELHTGFQLEAKGEYLALVRPDGLSVASKITYPGQHADISFGTDRQTTEFSFISPHSTARFLVPTNGALGQGWSANGFNDSGWLSLKAGIGYQVDTGGAGAGQPLAYWDFNGDARDRSGNGIDGTLLGPGFSGAVPPGGGSASAVFDGGGDYISAPLDVSEGSYTCSLWFRTTNANAGLFCVVDADLGSGGNDRHLYLSGGNIASRVWNNETIRSSGFSLADGQWHHLAHAYGGNTGGQRIYIDGTLAAGGGKAQSDFNWQRHINIGFSNDAAQQYLAGNIDEVALWSEALDAAQVGALANGASPMALGGFDPVIISDVENRMRNINATAYLRSAFTAAELDQLDQLELRMRYDDGFIAYLNGTEIARREAPANPLWNSQATSNRPNTDVLTREIIDISSHLGLLNPGSNTLAVHALNNGATSSNFLLLPELVGVRIDEEAQRYFISPTPGTANSGGVVDFVADTKFSHDRGFYDNMFEVTVSSATPGAFLVYTLDGSKPSLGNGIAVAAADDTSPPSVNIPISSTSTLRAAAFRSGWQPTNVDTHSYIFIDAVARQPAWPAGFPGGWSGAGADYGVDSDVVNSTLPGYSFREALLSIPTMSITSAPGDIFGAQRGIYYHSTGRGRPWEREISLEMFHPEGSTAFQEDCGARMHGNSSRSHGFTLKHPFRILFRNEYGAGKLRHKLFPDSSVERFDQILLRGASTDSWPVVDGGARWLNERGTYIRDQWVRNAQIALGQPSSHGTYVHLFVNGLYWGLYNPSERPTSSFTAEHLGGDKDEWDIFKDFAELREGNRSAWDQMFAQANAGLSGNSAYQRIQGNNPNGTRNPAYPVLVDVDNLIDYMLVHIYIGGEDWHQHNWWAGRRRGPESTGFKWFAWDQEISNESLTRTVSLAGARFEDPYYGRPGPAHIYGKLLDNQVFRWRFQDRVHEVLFNDGPLTAENAAKIWLALQDGIDQAIVGESARWGDTRDAVPHKRETSWLREMDWMQNIYWEANHARVLRERFQRVGIYPNIAAPAFSRVGGVVPSAAQLFFEAGDLRVYYTTDGSDPRGPGGSPSPSARIYNGGSQDVVLLPKNSTWKYLDDGSDLGSAWSAPGFDDSNWASGPGQFGYNEGDEATVVSYGGVSSDKHITTYFRTTLEIPVAGAVSDLSLGVLRDDGATLYLNGTEIARSNMPGGVISHDTAALSNALGADERTYHAFEVDPALLVDGTNVLAAEVHQVHSQSSDLSFDATLDATVQTSVEPVEITASGTINARAYSGSEWSGMNSGRFIVGAQLASRENLVISEIHYRPAAPRAGEAAAGFSSAGDFEFIELANISPGPVDLAGAHFENGIDFDFSAEADFTEIAPGGHVLLVANRAAFEQRYGNGLPVIGRFGNATSLANNGERLRLVSAGNEPIRDFAYDDKAPWPTTADGGGFSLNLVNPAANPDHSLPASWRAGLDPGGSPGETDGGIDFAAWQRAWFDPSSGDFPLSSAAAADPDGDGTPNAMEFLLGNSPLSPGAQGIEVGSIGAGENFHLTLSFTRRATLAGAAWQIEQCTVPGVWSPAQIFLIQSVAQGGLIRETHCLIAPMDATPWQMVRLRVSL